MNRPRVIAAALLVAAVVGVLAFSTSRHHESVTASSIPNRDMKVEQAAPPVADQQKSPPIESVRPDSRPQPFRIKVERHQTLRDISVQYLGEFNEKRLRQIRTLNPSMKNPNHVLVGQSIWLPGPSPSNLAKSELISTEARSLP
jgi:nucleoid-associated protein YgaU